MSARRYMEIIWMDMIGIGFISVGLYMIIFLSLQTPIYAPMGFILMVFGLFFSTIGGFYGKKKLIEGSAEKLPLIETKQIDQLKQNVVSQLKPPGTAGASPSQSPQAKPEAKPAPSENAVPSDQPALQAEQPAPAEGIVKILMCPGCDTENPPTNMFCFNCGKRLRAGAKSGGQKRSKKRAGAAKRVQA